MDLNEKISGKQEKLTLRDYVPLFFIFGVFLIGYGWGYLAHIPILTPTERQIMQALKRDGYERTILTGMIRGLRGENAQPSIIFQYYARCRELMDDEEREYFDPD